MDAVTHMQLEGTPVGTLTKESKPTISSRCCWQQANIVLEDFQILQVSYTGLSVGDEIIHPKLKLSHLLEITF